jgi:hypothetical protein
MPRALAAGMPAPRTHGIAPLARSGVRFVRHPDERRPPCGRAGHPGHARYCARLPVNVALVSGAGVPA